MEWKTKFQIYADYMAYANPQAMSFCDTLMQKAKSKPNTDPKHKKDPLFRLYKVPRKDVEGSSDRLEHQKSYSFTGEVAQGGKVVEDL
eukprot:7909020-Pyramimonas_sp.AAC.1